MKECHDEEKARRYFLELFLTQLYPTILIMEIVLKTRHQHRGKFFPVILD